MQSLPVSTSTPQALRAPCLEDTELRDLNPGALIQRGEVSGPRSPSTMKASGRPPLSPVSHLEFRNSNFRFKTQTSHSSPRKLNQEADAEKLLVDEPHQNGVPETLPLHCDWCVCVCARTHRVPVWTSLYRSVAVAGWTPLSGSVTPTAHPLSIHFPSAQVIKKHLCFSIRLHIWGECLSHRVEEGTQGSSGAQLWCDPGSHFCASVGGQEQA